MLMNTGETPKRSHNGLLTTIAWGLDGKISYALEGSVFVAGSAIQWLRDGLHLLEKASDSEEMAEAVTDSDGVIVVPAFVGLGAPYWDDKCRGAIFGITRGTTTNHLVRATLESLAYQSADLLEAMEEDACMKINMLKVDGGAVRNQFLMQFQADLLDREVKRPKNNEATALGAAYLAGLAVGYWNDLSEIEANQKISHTYLGQMDESRRTHLLKEWKKAVQACCSYHPE